MVNGVAVVLKFLLPLPSGRRSRGLTPGSRCSSLLRSRASVFASSQAKCAVLVVEVRSEMSLKRYATLLAFGQHQSQSQNQNHTISATTTSVAPTTDGISSSQPSSSPFGSFSSEELMSQSQEHISSSSSIATHTTYYTGGLGQYHQQRGGSGSVISGVGGGGGPGGPQTYANVVNGNVNLLLGGAMLSLVTTILCVVCYCCHRNIKKRTEAAYRQQQHQWLEGDPNMEIYSVEQCYETSGLFLGDSTDGLSAVPALHHEPPPSYDAVVLHEQQLHQQQLEQQQQQQLQLQLQQQQQLLMQRVSPPPGYRSSLDLSGQQGTSFGRGTPDGSVDAVASGSASGPNGRVLVNKQLQLALNAQSCCSLQRAEVESMWNAAAAAVAARSGNCLEMETLQVRKPPAQNIRLNTFGRRYLQQSHQHGGNHYRRGCPLCGKFRYEGEAEDEPLTALSVESGLNMGGQREEEEEPTLCPCPSDLDNGNHVSVDALQDEANGNVEATAINEPPIPTTAVNDENDNAATPDTPATLNTPATSHTPATTSNSRELAEEQEQATGQQDEQDLNNINENGIISLDMSKIIDRSGLPTYEGAIKLESSGYV
ncbi:mediator of RNA polymerase II transcription subunit 15 [Drosophila ficusphila]|uniref:mediator of RNA polymerase II transcription subunit 15 n=1 Tax=Drosophila ficusphila TaxID=30025 RepID=UPI0007E77200|nr:mediator of RNA polymerase II transcription subunit 15 [Drosophila ficusphila]